MTSFSPVESWSILSGIDLAGRSEPGKLSAQGSNSKKVHWTDKRAGKRKARWERARAAAKSPTKAADEWASKLPTHLVLPGLSRLQVVLKRCQTFCGHPTGLEAPPGLLLPVRFTQPPGLTPPDACHQALLPGLPLPAGFRAPPGLECPNGCHPESPPGLWLPKEDVSGSDDLIESDDEDTSAGTGSMKPFGDSDPEETASEAEEGLPMKAHAPCFPSTPMSPVFINSVCYLDRGSVQDTIAIQPGQLLCSGKLRHQRNVEK